jgi:hypothetical protein
MSGGGGGPKFSFKTSLNTNATEFVPSWLPKEPSAAPAASAPSKKDASEDITKHVKKMEIKPAAPKGILALKRNC